MDARRIVMGCAAAALAGSAASQAVVSQQPLLEKPAMPSATLSGVFAPAANRSVIDDFVPGSGGQVDRIRFVGGSPANVYGFAVRVYEIDAEGQRGSLVSSVWPNIARANPRPIGQGWFEYAVALPAPVRVEAGVTYGLEVNAFLAVPDLIGDRGWSWAAGAGDGRVLIDEQDGKPLTGFAAEGVAFSLDGTPDQADEGCLADVNADGTLSSADFFAWVSAFSSRDPAADQNGDGLVTSADFFAWVTNFNAGC
ncbi:MAG: GC-type dockerin domain-anchored protein [Planctomycetota bacterium]